MQSPQRFDATHGGELFPVDENGRSRRARGLLTSGEPGAEGTGVEIWVHRIRLLRATQRRRRVLRHCWRPPRRCANNVQTRSNGIRSTLGHDGRGGLALADAGAASNAYRNESRDQSDEYFFHWNSPFFHATRCTLRASLHRWSPAEANGSPAPETVGHFKGDCVLGDTVTRRVQQNLPESGSRSAPPAPTTPRLFQG